MFNTEFNDELPEKFAKLDLYPESLRKEIDEQNEWVYDTVNNGECARSRQGNGAADLFALSVSTLLCHG